MSDIDEPFLPLPVDKMLFPSMASIDWNRIASLVPRIPGSESCFGSVLKFVSALQLQREQTARGAGDNNKAKAAAKGSELDKPLPLHLVAFASCLPKVGLGKLAVRSPLDEAPQQKQFYEHLGDEYLQHSIAVDLFVANNGAYFDWATFGVFLQRCGGRTLSYCPFDATGTFAATLAHDMTALLWPTSPDSATTGVVYATYVACRVGLGLDVDGANAKVLRFARFSSHSTVSFPIKFTSSQLQDKTVGVQVACLFTTRAGREMVRVVSYPWQPANTTVSALFRAADLEPIVLVLLRSSLPKPSLYEALNEQLVGILARYRKHCTTNPSPGQLILPETLKTLPALFTAAVHSLSAFWTPVERLSLSLHVSLEDCMALVYPNVYTIDGDSIVGVRASAELVRRDAILVIENGVYVFVVGPEGSMQLRPVLDVLAMCQRRRGRGLRVRHVRDERDPLWSFAMSCLAEDSLKPAGAGTGVGLGVAGRPGALSYVEYLCGLHKQIQTRIQRETESMLQHIHM
jgi:protein transport protein SEC24